MDAGERIHRVELSPRLRWLFKSKPRALAVHEHGLVVETGAGTALVPWTEVRSVIGGVVDVTSTAGARGGGAHTHYVIAYLGGGELTLRAGSARPDYRRLVELIVEKANLEWFQGSLGGRALPPMAVKPEAAKNLRASLDRAIGPREP